MEEETYIQKQIRIMIKGEDIPYDDLYQQQKRRAAENEYIRKEEMKKQNKPLPGENII